MDPPISYTKAVQGLSIRLTVSSRKLADDRSFPLTFRTAAIIGSSKSAPTAPDTIKLERILPTHCSQSHAKATNAVIAAARVPTTNWVLAQISRVHMQKSLIE